MSGSHSFISRRADQSEDSLYEMKTKKNVLGNQFQTRRNNIMHHFFCRRFRCPYEIKVTVKKKNMCNSVTSVLFKMYIIHMYEYVHKETASNRNSLKI